MLRLMKSRFKGKTLKHTLYFFLLITQISFGQWVQVGLNDETIKDIAVQNQNMFAVTADSEKLYRSVDSGLNWTVIVDSNVVDVAISTTGKVFMIKDSLFGYTSLYSSLDNGLTWTIVEGLPILGDTSWPASISVSPVGYLFVGLFIIVGLGGQSGFTLSTDDGLSWADIGQVPGGKLFDFRDQKAITIGVHSSIHTWASYFSFSADYGNTWDMLYANSPPLSVVALGLFTNGNIMIGTQSSFYPSIADSGVYISSDSCITWTKIATLIANTGLSWSSGPSEGMLIGTEDLGIFLFSDEGDNLGSINEFLTNLNIHTLLLDNNSYVYAGTGNGVWRRPLSEIIISIEQEPTQPTEFIIEQNYPNPFNPSTVISYQLPVSSEVILKVFDVLGNEVATLVDEYKTAGTYELTWNAKQLPSGVYFYQLKASNYIDTKKMLLLK